MIPKIALWLLVAGAGFFTTGLVALGIYLQVNDGRFTLMDFSITSFGASGLILYVSILGVSLTRP